MNRRLTTNLDGPPGTVKPRGTMKDYDLKDRAQNHGARVYQSQPPTPDQVMVGAVLAIMDSVQHMAACLQNIADSTKRNELSAENEQIRADRLQRRLNKVEIAINEAMAELRQLPNVADDGLHKAMGYLENALRNYQ